VSNDGGMVIHAHPFREAFYIPEVRLYPEHIDGVEAVNLGNNTLDPTYNVKAIEYAKKHNFPMTGGSDIHALPAMDGGMEFDHKLEDIFDYIKAVKNHEGKVRGM